jgi:hypothetical protein
MTGPYTDWAHEYLAAGWSPIPLPHKKKGPPPTGYTGNFGEYLDPDQVDEFIRLARGKPRNIGLRMPDTVLGIDVDHYDDKTGGDTLAAWTAKLGPLPDTWRSSSRANDRVSGIRFYRVPAGRRWASHLEGGAVEIVNHHHRFAVIYPSLHDKSGLPYQFTDPDGFPSEDIPSVDELPDLPDPWVQHLDRGDFWETLDDKDSIAQGDAMDWLTTYAQPGNPCKTVRGALDETLEVLRADGASHHDQTLKGVMRLVRNAEQGHEGVLDALDDLKAAHFETAGRVDEPEWFRMVVGGVARALSKRTEFEDYGCHCRDDAEPDVDLADVLADEGAPDKEKGETWGRVDLTGIIDEIISGAYQPPMPTVGQFGDRALFYKDAVNSVAGPPSSGKTWVVLVAARQEMEAGRDVVYIDMENGVGPFISRLINDMGVDAGLIKDRLVYIFPEEKLGLESASFLKDALRGVRPSLIALDTTGVSMALERTAPNDDDAVALWFKNIPSALARRTGAAVVLIDHVPKNSENDSPIGSQRKMAAVDAQYMLRNGTRFSRTADGLADVVCSKDRHGRFTPGDTICRLSMRHVDDQLEALLVDVGNTEDVAGLSAMEQHVLQRIQEHYDENHGTMDENDEEIDARPNITMVRSLCTGNNAAIKAAVEALVSRGLLLPEVLASKTPGRNPVVYTPLAPDFDIEA